MPMPAWCRRGRRSPGRRCACSSGTRPSAAEWPRPGSSCEAGCGGAAGRRASSSSKSSWLLRRLPGLAQHALAGVTDALALVGLGLADLADVGGDLADRLLVDALHDDAGRRRHLERDAVGRLDRDRVTEPEGEIELARTSSGGAVADAHDLELLGEAGRHADD